MEIACVLVGMLSLSFEVQPGGCKMLSADQTKQHVPFLGSVAGRFWAASAVSCPRSQGSGQESWRSHALVLAFLFKWGMLQLSICPRETVPRSTGCSIPSPVSTYPPAESHALDRYSTGTRRPRSVSSPGLGRAFPLPKPIGRTFGHHSLCSL